MKERSVAVIVVVIVASSALIGCGQRGERAGSEPAGTVDQVTTPPAVPTTDPYRSAPSETPRSTPTQEPAPSRVATFRVQNSDGYVAVLKLTFHDLVTFASESEADPVFSSCAIWPRVGRVRALGLKVAGEVIPQTVNGFTWPEGKGVGANVFTSSTGAFSSGNHICDGEQFSGPHAAAGKPASGWMFFVSEITPKRPLGWDKPMPWSEVRFEVGGAGVETCKVLTKHKTITIDSDAGPHACGGTFAGR